MTEEKSTTQEDGFQRFQNMGTGVTRYECECELHGEPTPAKDGEWCKYEDHKEAVDSLYAQMERRDRDVIQARKGARAANDQYRGLRDDRRFEAAKAAMQGLLAAGFAAGTKDMTDRVAMLAAKQADALLEALSGDGGITHEED